MTQELTEVACPFCGLACDDLTLRVDAAGISRVDNACPRGRALFQRIGAASAPAGAWKKGVEVDSEAALEAAFQLIKGAKNPLFGGLSTDVLGMRGLMALADRIGAVVDHMNAEAKLKNLKTVQDIGWITTTLGEVKNRADVVLAFGTDVVSRFPRFFERFVTVTDSLFVESSATRKVIFIGEGVPPEETFPKGMSVQHLKVPTDRLAEVAALLRGLTAGTLDSTVQTDLPVVELKAITETLRAAKYGVVTWVAPDLPWAHAELAIQSLTGWIAELNTSTRAAGLPLGGSDGDFSSDAVLLWQSGYPFRTSFASGTGEYDPVMFSSARLLDNQEVDALLWVGSFDPDRPLPTPRHCPVIALTPAGAPVLPDVDVQITVATPGVNVEGYYFRADKVVTIPLKAPVKRSWPTVQSLTHRWLHELGEVAC